MVWTISLKVHNSMNCGPSGTQLFITSNSVFRIVWNSTEVYDTIFVREWYIFRDRCYGGVCSLNPEPLMEFATSWCYPVEKQKREVVLIGACLVLLVAGSVLLDNWREYEPGQLEKVVQALEVLHQEKCIFLLLPFDHFWSTFSDLIKIKKLRSEKVDQKWSKESKREQKGFLLPFPDLFFKEIKEKKGTQRMEKWAKVWKVSKRSFDPFLSFFILFCVKGEKEAKGKCTFPDAAGISPLSLEFSNFSKPAQHILLNKIDELHLVLSINSHQKRDSGG